MIDWYFQCKDLDSFIADLDALSNFAGIPPLTITGDKGEELLPQCVIINDKIRVDFDWIDDLVGVPPVLDASGNVVTPAIMRGPHCNMRIAVMPGVDPAPYAALLQKMTNLFNAQSAATEDTPAAMLSKYAVIARQVRKTSRGTCLIVPAPSVAKRAWL